MSETRLLIPKDDGVTVKLDKTGMSVDSLSHVWVGMSKKELDEFASDPFWVRVRCFLFGVYWSSMALLSVAVVVLVVRAPRCSKVQWWQEGPMYGVFSPDFTHKAGLSGIEQKLDYIVDLGVKTIWLSPIYKSPMKDFGYDIEDFKDVDPRFGTLQSFRDLVAAMKARDLKLVMDLVPNHSSDQHEWFQKSLARLDPYTDYYVWADAKQHDEDGKPVPPNNWLSVLGGSAWEWSEERSQFYLHQFAKEQPDLNFRNEAVKNEMLDVMKFWLELGVDGFRVDALPHLFEDEALRDEPALNETTYLQGEYEGLQHLYTHNLPEVFTVMADFRRALDAYSEKTDKVRRLMMAEAFEAVEKTLEYKNGDDKQLVDLPFNLYLMTNIKRESTATVIKETIELWMKNLPETKWANWVLGNHDHGRVASRYGGDLVDCLNMILLLLPGTAVTYFGEELGIENAPVSWDQTVDPMGFQEGSERYRDPPHIPMQWSPSKNAGSSDADNTWDYQNLNMPEPSHLSVYKALVHARTDTSIMYGTLHMKVFNDSVFAFTRAHSETRSYVVAVNWSDNLETVDLTEFTNMPQVADIYVTSANFTASLSKTMIMTAVELDARQGIVLTYTPETQD